MQKITVWNLKQEFPKLTFLAKKIIELNRDYYGQQTDFEKMSFQHLKLILENRGVIEAFRKCSLEESETNISIAKKARTLWRGIVKQLGKTESNFLLKSALLKAQESLFSIA